MKEKINLAVDIERIEKELINSGLLVANKIEPYYSLSCFRQINYDLKTCFEICPRFKKCFDMFVNNHYLTKIEINTNIYLN